MLTITIISAGIGMPSQSSALAQCIADHVKNTCASVRIRIIELRPLAKEVLQANLAQGAGLELKAALEDVSQADTLIVITPLYNSSYSGLFKMFVDLLDAKVMHGKPVLLAATAGTIRHSLALDGPLRSLFAYFRALIVPTVILATPSDWSENGVPELALKERIERAAREMMVLAGK
jgi:FMN reductase